MNHNNLQLYTNIKDWCSSKHDYSLLIEQFQTKFNKKDRGFLGHLTKKAEKHECVILSVFKANPKSLQKAVQWQCQQ